MNIEDKSKEGQRGGGGLMRERADLPLVAIKQIYMNIKYKIYKINKIYKIYIKYEIKAEKKMNIEDKSKEGQRGGGGLMRERADLPPGARVGNCR